MQLVGEANGVKEFYRIGADVDAGAELDEFGRLLVDLHFEFLPAERDGRRQPAKPRSDDRNPTRVAHLMLPDTNVRSERPLVPSRRPGPLCSKRAAAGGGASNHAID